MNLAHRWQKLFPRNVPQDGRLVLRQSRLYILPTRFGLAYLLMLGMMLAGAINYDLSLGYALAFWLLAAMAVSALHAHLNLAGLALSARFERPVFAGDGLVLHVNATQETARPRPALRLGRRGDWGLAGEDAVEFDVLGGGAETRLALPTQQRGRFTAPRLTLETRYPLGLFRCWSYLDFDAQELVYPALERPAPPLPPHAPSSGEGGRWTMGGDEFAGLREWRQEDAPRLIAWRQSARNNQLLTKTFQTDQGHELWLDWAATAGEVEARLSRLAAWVQQAEAHGYRYGLRLPGTEYAPGHGPRHQERCLAALALFR